MVILVPLAIMILQYQNMADKQACLPSWHPYTLSCLGTKQFEVIKALFLIKTFIVPYMEVGKLRLISSDFSESLSKG